MRTLFFHLVYSQACVIHHNNNKRVLHFALLALYIKARSGHIMHDAVRQTYAACTPVSFAG